MLDDLRALHVALGSIKVGFSQLITNTGTSDNNQSQDKDQGLIVWRAIEEQRTSTCNLEQQLTEVAGQLCELLRGGV